MSFQTLLPVLAIILGGAAIALQAPINGRLAMVTGGPIIAAAISFGVGFALLTVIALARGDPAFPSGVAQLPWWIWTGGALGTIYVAAAAWSVPQIGVVTMVAALIFGQMFAALILDATGAFGLPVREISMTRILAVLFVVAGIVLSRL